MNDLLQAMAGVGWTSAAIAFVVFLRVGAAMAALPVLGEQLVPARVRLALALSLTAIVAPAVADPVSPLTTSTARLLFCLASETMIGLSLGIVLRLFVLALEIAGTMAAQASSLSQLFGSGGAPMPTISHILLWGGLAFAVMAGLHVRFVEVLILSYDALPPGSLPDADLVRGWSLGHIGRAFSLAFSLAAPFAIAALIYNIALGVINRAMPQLMVAFVGAPALAAGALCLLVVAVPFGLMLWLAAFEGFLNSPFGAPR